MWSDMDWPRIQRYGIGHYPKIDVEKPDCLQSVPRKYSRYGLPYEAVSPALSRLTPPPDLIFITSIMTYWYPGVQVVIDLARSIYPRVPIVLGGIYATLCSEHAEQNCDVDLVIKGPVEDRFNWSRIWNLLQEPAPEVLQSFHKAPALDLYPEPEYSIVQGSRGCPFHCEYCASDLLFPCFEQRGLDSVWADLARDLARGIRDFAFYDDALLVTPKTWLEPALERIIAGRFEVRLHTPNALHVRYLTPSLCDLLQRAGLTTVRLGLETADFGERWDRKLSSREWEAGMTHLFAAGFRPEQIGAYILFGLPGQDRQEVVQTIRFAKQFKIRPHLAHYSPIPGSRLFVEAKTHSPYPLEEEPLFQNNSIWPCVPGGFTWQEQTYWKKMLEEGEE